MKYLPCLLTNTIHRIRRGESLYMMIYGSLFPPWVSHVIHKPLQHNIQFLHSAVRVMDSEDDRFHFGFTRCRFTFPIQGMYYIVVTQKGAYPEFDVTKTILVLVN